MTKERPNHIWMIYDEDINGEGRWQAIQYVGVLDYCMYCKHQVHSITTCTLKKRDEKRKKELEETAKVDQTSPLVSPKQCHTDMRDENAKNETTYDNHEEYNTHRKDDTSKDNGKHKEKVVKDNISSSPKIRKKQCNRYLSINFPVKLMFRNSTRYNMQAQM